MSKKDKESATRRKRAAQNKAGRGGTSSISGGGRKPIRVKTKAENVMNLEELVGKPITEAQFDEAAGEKEVGDGDEVQKGDQIIINPDILYWLSFVDF